MTSADLVTSAFVSPSTGILKNFSIPRPRRLTDKRLELAYYQLAEKKKKPTEIYLEVGFEDLSHFSFIFKKKYGISPTQLLLNS